MITPSQRSSQRRPSRNIANRDSRGRLTTDDCYYVDAISGFKVPGRDIVNNGGLLVDGRSFDTFDLQPYGPGVGTDPG